MNLGVSCPYKIIVYSVFKHLYINLRSHDVVVRSLLAGRMCGRTAVRQIKSVRFWAAFTLTAHINALYNERVCGKEEHAT